MEVLSIEKEIVFRQLVALGVAIDDAKRFCVLASDAHFAKVLSMTSAYASLGKRIDNLQWAAFEKSFSDSGGDVDAACPSPDELPEMETFRRMIVAIFLSIYRKYPST